MYEKEIQNEIKDTVKGKLFPLLALYGFDISELEAILKWRPIVLIIGNYSSGKSTFVNELLGREIQRTGQAPTDDSFTIITAPGPDEDEAEIPGSTLVNDENLPFTSMKAYGEKLSSHFQMKLVKSRFLENLAIIDSPGMLDSVTEKGRGYDFPKVVGDFAKLADLVVLMFDPHKAGTIKETYTTIRNTLPETSREDRIIFVMSRIDECDNLRDLVRSFGTLCWNLSQMTGRKDIPRIYLTFSTEVAQNTVYLDDWIDERNQLIHKILEAPGLRTSHILSNIDRQVNELKMTIEAMVSFARGKRRLLLNAVKLSAAGIVFTLFILDVICKYTMGFPQEAFVVAIVSGRVALYNLMIPLAGTVCMITLIGFWFCKWTHPGYIKKCKADIDHLVSLDTAYKEHIWPVAKEKVSTMISKVKLKEFGFSHQKNLDKTNKFIKTDLQRYFKSE